MKMKIKQNSNSNLDLKKKLKNCILHPNRECLEESRARFLCVVVGVVVCVVEVVVVVVGVARSGFVENGMVDSLKTIISLFAANKIHNFINQ